MLRAPLQVEVRMQGHDPLEQLEGFERSPGKVPKGPTAQEILIDAHERPVDMPNL